MKHLFVLMFAVSICTGQKPSENQRFQIFNLGIVGDNKLPLLLDTQTGRTWFLTEKDTLYIMSNSTLDIFSGKGFIWHEIYFDTKNILGSDYVVTPPVKSWQDDPIVKKK